ncbi:MAG TPA: MATE family efflux transporter [Kiritimatiellia bacterium]|nr:MATE family efflux transporter [Kiritimatiellia bacterium]
MNDRDPVLTPGGYRETLKVAWPLILSMGSFTLMQFTDRLFLAWYSAVSIQAALPAGILSFTMVSGFMALAGYANTFVAQYHGAGNGPGCSRATAQGTLLALASWPLMLALIPLGLWLLRISGHAPAVLAEERAYFAILMLGGVTAPLGAAVGGFFSGRGDTFTTMVTNVMGNVLNIVLDYAMIFGRWGFPEMGIRGAAWATVISGFVSPALLLLLYFSRRYDQPFRTRAEFRWDAVLLRRMLRFGLPAALHLVLDVGAFTLFVLLTGRLGATALAASNIALSINNIAFMPLIGISIAASILVGQYQGRRQGAIAEKAGWTSLKLGWIYMGVIALTFALFPQAYFRLFTWRGGAELPLENILPVGRWLLLMMAAWGLLDAVNLILSGALKGAGDTRFVMIYSVVMAWGFWMSGEMVIIFLLGGGIVPAWAWMTAFVFVMAAGFLWRFRSGRWKTIELIERQTPIQPTRPGAEALIAGD